ncbi:MULTISPECIES: L,D-transpeptidase [unclassified Anabaena]|uniref:L,D-transpeptidase n=1 Tax=unclassified Anabaena TaxID=2619674 RepID=UPI000831D1F9|nr:MULTISPECIES: L,D-transpeptidase [unclassified Anabaena]
MQNWIRSISKHYSKNFSTGIVLIMTALLSGLPAIAVEPNQSKALSASGDDKNITPSHVQQIALSRRIIIDLSQQRLFAWEGNRLVYSFRISTGKRSTPTPTGRFTITSKYRTHRMRGRGYDIPDVPYAMYFYKGYAIHGAYWHNRFGTPVSNGCVNLTVNQARKLYNWASAGTVVVVEK